MNEQPILPRAALADLLNVSPQALRRILRDYAEVLGEMKEGEVPAEALPVLRTIVELRGEGLRREEILAVLRQEGTAEEAPKAPEADVLTALGTLTALVERSLAAAEEERDRLLTALVRTQQELAGLREDLLLLRSRRDRKRRRLFPI